MSPTAAGYFSIYSDIIEVAGRATDLERYAESCERRPASTPGRWVYYLRPGQRLSDQLRDGFLTALTRQHETRHHQDVHTTSFGLLLWRTEVCISHDVEWILRLIRDSGFDAGGAPPHGQPSLHVPRPLRGTPLLEWLDKWGLAALCAAPPARFGEDGLETLLRPVVAGLEDLLRFRDVLLSYPTPALTVRQTLELANRALDYLRIRCDLRSTWHFTSAFEPDGFWPRPTLPPPADGTGETSPALGTPTTATWLLELSAWISEFFTIAAFDDPDGRMAELWWEGLDGREIGEAVGFSGVGDIPPEWAEFTAVVVQRSLSGACDPALNLEFDPHLEDVLPPNRFATAFEELFSAEEPLLPSLEEILLNYAFSGEMAPRGVYIGLARAELNGTRGWGADTLKAGLDAYVLSRSPLIGFTPYRLQEFRRAFFERLERPLFWANFSDAGGATPIHGPLIEIFDDRLLPIRPVGVDADDAGVLYRSAITTAALGEVSAILIGGRERASKAEYVLDRFVEVHNAHAVTFDPPRPSITRADLVPEWVPDYMVDRSY